MGYGNYNKEERELIHEIRKYYSLVWYHKKRLMIAEKEMKILKEKLKELHLNKKLFEK